MMTVRLEVGGYGSSRTRWCRRLLGSNITQSESCQICGWMRPCTC